MNPLKTFRVAFRALLRNKIRSFLTTLGIIIGVSAVIVVVAIGEGVKSTVGNTFASLGANILIVMPGTTTRGGAFGGFGSMPTLTWDDLKAIQTEAPAVRAAAAVLQTSAQVMSEDQNWTTSVSGTTPEYFEARSWGVERGVLFGPSDVDGGNKVALLGQTVVEKLFGSGVEPVGQMIRIKNMPFLVVGVLVKKGQSPVGQDLDDSVFIPQSTFQAKIRGGLQKFISGVVFVSAVSPEATGRAQDQITDILRDRHHIKEGSDDDFSIRNMSELGSALEQSTSTLRIFLVILAVVSLVVGGIGIMNIMLVSVTERTREIGIRMAVGAKPRHILAQFLVEALTLSVAGGIIGILTGIVISQLVAKTIGWPILLRTDVIVIAVVFSALVGVIFGLYPAWKASRLDPIDALRYE